MALALAATLLAGCGGPGAADGRRTVVTSFYPLQYVTQRIAGNHAEVVDLTHPGQEPHDLELSVRQTAQLVDADVVVYERGFQAAVDQAVDQSGPEHVVDAARSGRVVDDDPHFWLDPTRLSRVAGAVEKELAATDPAHRADYARNLAVLQHDLAGLDAAYAKRLASCRIGTIVVSHDAFGYLGRRYGLRVVGINGLSPDAEPSPSHVRQLQDLIRQDGITTVFSEELASRKLADSLASDLRIHAEVLDPVEGLSDATADQDYLSLMRRNLVTLEKANRCS
jgi:zinc transport system substrate-binding protein